MTLRGLGNTRIHWDVYEQWTSIQHPEGRFETSRLNPGLAYAGFWENPVSAHIPCHLLLLRANLLPEDGYHFPRSALQEDLPEF